MQPQSKRSKLTEYAASRGSNGPTDAPKTLSPLEMLPRELAFAIMDYVLERFPHLRKTSRALNNRTGEYSRETSTIPLVEELCFDTKNEAGRIHLTVCLSKEKAHLFDLRFKQRRAAVKSTTRVVRSVRELTNDKLALYKFELLDGDSELWKCVLAAAGKVTDRVSLCNCFGVRVLDTITYFLEDFKIGMLEVICDTMTESVADHIVETIIAHGIRHLTLNTAEIFNMPNEKEFLLKLSTLLQSIHISNFDCFHASEPLNAVIVDLLSRRTDKLFIESRNRAHSPSDIRDLEQRIPNLGKEIWLRSSCYETGRKETVLKNDHLIYVEQVQKGKRTTNYCLNIKHTSRSEEPPEKQSRLKCPVPKKPLSPRSLQRYIHARN